MKGCGEWRRTFQAEETAGPEGLECGGAADGWGPLDKCRLPGQPWSSPVGLRIRGWVPSHWNRREREKAEGDSSESAALRAES